MTAHQFLTYVRSPGHPGFSLDAVQWLLGQGALGRRGALGTDAFSPDVGVDDTFAVSKLLYRGHRISLEVLANLDQLPPRGFWLAVGGFINIGGTGSPAIVYALLPNRCPSANATRTASPVS